VDGQQRMTTILEYFTGSPAMKLTKDLIAYHELSDAQKKDFLNYDVAVRNLGFVTREQIIDIFRRINSTNYSLNDMEINNAMYAGKFKLFCEGLAELEFFEKKSFFRPMQLRRMGDVKYIATIIITMIGGYFNRDDLLEEYLRRYNDEFPEEDDLRNRFSRNLSCIEQLGLDEKSRAWKQSDFFTLICEIDNLQHVKNQKIDVRKSKVKLTKFYEAMNFPHELMQPEFAKLHEEVQAYTSATIQAANDRTNRVLRGRLIRERIVSR
jgi:hypothetical protein